ncbi:MULTISPECIES: Gldg family protein [Butyricimonas]|uniref:Gldg family protein n=1 Tax=Butyricimonas TaxID=574697 RepID=UPI0007FB3865|nr:MULTISPECIES: Gldg family protein [Butyricimonas]
MKMIFKIAKKELQLLFYSPVAWFLLLVFTLQAGIMFVGQYHGYMKDNEYGDGLQFMVSSALFVRTLWGQVSTYLYFYIPLLTMGLVSRELSSGSIKMLYAAPVTNTQIILGKFCSMVGYAFVMSGMLCVYIVIAWCTVENFELPMVLSGLLGLFLLTCTYAAVGIFVSSLTSYQFVAAIGTFIVLMLLSLVGGWWQEYDFVRDVTYWLSINGRAQTFIGGMICSEDLLYFPLVTALFLGLTIIRLNAVRQKIKFLITLRYNLILILGACCLGYLSSRPKLMAYYDATSVKSNTLTPQSQEIVETLEGNLTITAYVNIMSPDYGSYAYPYFIQRNRRVFKLYERFKPETKLKVVYYYDTLTPGEAEYLRIFEKGKGKTLRQLAKEVCEENGLDSTSVKTPEEIRERIDLTGERTFVWSIERGNGQQTWLRTFDDPLDIFPHEADISAAFKKVGTVLPKVGFVKGHGCRSIQDGSLGGYNRFASVKYARLALVNQGFDVEEVGLSTDIPEDITILTIPEPKEVFLEEEMDVLRRYSERGGNFLILGEAGRGEAINPFLQELFGVQLTEGTLVQYREIEERPEVLYCEITPEASALSYRFQQLTFVRIPTVAGVEVIEDRGFKATPILKTDTLAQNLEKKEDRSYRVWNETGTLDYADKPLEYNPEKGEVAKEYNTALALSREVNGKEQRVVVFGDADWLSNQELSVGRTGGHWLALSVFHYLSGNEMPVDTRRSMTQDRVVHVNSMGYNVLKWSLMFIYPLFFLSIGTVIWIRRRGR